MIALYLIIAVIVVMWATSVIDKPQAVGTSAGDTRSVAPQRILSGCARVVVVVSALLIFFGVCLVPIGPGNGHPVQNGAMQATRALALAMYAYANDHDEKYPVGASSTEVFQKLLDGHYVTDPSLFFVPLPGKVQAKPDARLKPKNVAYDVTSGVDGHSPDTVPVVFLTGFRMDYRAGADVVSLVKPLPRTVASIRSWFSDHRAPSTTFDGLPVAYKSNNAFFHTNRGQNGTTSLTPDGYGIVPHVMAPDFDPGGQNYRQLTPDGVLK